MAKIATSQNNGDMSFSVDINDYGDGDVVAFMASMHKLGKFKAAIKNMSQQGGSLRQYLNDELNFALDVEAEWVEPGADCEILRVGGKDWQKGKIKVEITVKFYPDEPEVEEINQAESPLDDIRLMMDKLS
jgi:hypothetical protein